MPPPESLPMRQGAGSPGSRDSVAAIPSAPTVPPRAGTEDVSGAWVAPAGRDRIEFGRLTEVAPEEILDHMSDPRMAHHMPLLTGLWSREVTDKFVADKEACWQRDGLGHWAILAGGRYVGWGGFQKEDAEWDFGLVLRPEAFGLGLAITGMALDFARSDPRIDAVTFLLAPSRRSFGALARMGAKYLGEAEHGNARFRKYRLETPGPAAPAAKPLAK